MQNFINFNHVSSTAPIFKCRNTKDYTAKITSRVSGAEIRVVFESNEEKFRFRRVEDQETGSHPRRDVQEHYVGELCLNENYVNEKKDKSCVTRQVVYIMKSNGLRME